MPGRIRHGLPPDPVPMTVIESIRFWFEASSIDGIGQAGRARNPLTRSMWVLILLVGIAATAYHLYWILIEYHDFQVRTTILLSPRPKVSKQIYDSFDKILPGKYFGSLISMYTLTDSILYQRFL